MSYIFNSADVFDFASYIGAVVKQNGKELEFKSGCPYCGETEGNFAVNLETGAFNCFRDTCKKQGHFVQLCRDFNYQLDFGEVKEYRKLAQPKAPIVPTDPAVEYLTKRGISKEVIEHYSVTTRKDNVNVLAFPFFDETGRLQFAKYRNINPNHTGPKEWCEKGTRPIFFGMHQTKGFDRLIITEGQIDSLTLASCGYENCISVSNGANSVPTNIANCYDWITQFKEIIVFGDWEYKRGDHMTLLDDLLNRLPTDIIIKAVRKCDYLGEKDANDILRKYGPDAIHKCIECAANVELDFMEDIADIKREDLSKRPKINTNIKELDALLGGLYLGTVTVVSGLTGEGKSTFVSQIIVEAIEQGVVTFVYSGELSGANFKYWLDLQCAGQKHIIEVPDENGSSSYVVPDDVLEKIEQWYRGKVKVYNNNSIIKRRSRNNDELDSLIIRIEKAIKRYGCKLIVLDNLMTAVEIDPEGNLYNAQTDFMKQLHVIAELYQVAIILVAHPKKFNPKEGFTNDSVSGASEVTKLADNVLYYGRNRSEKYDCDGLLYVTKNRAKGTQTGKDPLQFYYNPRSKRVSSKGSAYRTYGWENNSLISDDFDLPF